jgi:hypothetical protein
MNTQTPVNVYRPSTFTETPRRLNSHGGETDAKIFWFGPTRALCYTKLTVVLCFSFSVTLLLCSQDAVNANLELMKKGHAALQEGAQLVLNCGGQCVSIVASPSYPQVSLRGTRISSCK